MKEFTDTELAQEQWRDVEGYDGMYQVSDLGRVRSLKFGKVRVLRARKNGNGYLMVDLCKDGKVKRFLVHRLVAQAFIQNDDESKTIINHINECKSDDRAVNLEWCDYRYNSTYNDIHHRRNTKRCKIAKLYDPNLSIAENIDVFKANGIECTRQTLWQLRKDLNLKHRSNYKVNKIKVLYRPDLSIKQNLEIFRANGIECSKCTVIKLRKELGLTKTKTD